MAGGYVIPANTPVEQLIQQLESLRDQVRELQRPDGSQLNDAVKKLEQLVNDLPGQVFAVLATAVNTGDITASGFGHFGGEITAANISGANISASGQVTSAAPLKSPGSYALVVSGSNYRTAWIQSDGQVGYSPSTIRVKKDLEEFPDDLLDAFLACSPYLGRYTWDDEDSPLKVFLIAEHLADAGFGTDVVPQDDEGNAEAVNYSQVVVPLFAAVKRQQAQIQSLTERLDAAGL